MVAFTGDVTIRASLPRNDSAGCHTKTLQRPAFGHVHSAADETTGVCGEARVALQE